jgi:methylated-DNA-[protein]-cysteine S-methyltransferase
MNRTHLAVDSPLGPLTIVANADGLCGVYLPDHRHRPPTWSFGDSGRSRLLAAAAEQLAAYFEGTLTAFDLPLAGEGTPFQRRVWAALRTIPYGATRTYGQLATELGTPSASRAVGFANGRNPLSIVVPCHRVVGSSGRLVGYAGGLAAKEWLLDLERRVAQGGPVDRPVEAIA